MSTGQGSLRFDEFLLRFDELGGAMLSCSTCLQLRKIDAAAVCPMSAMDDLARLTEDAARMLTFG